MDNRVINDISSFVFIQDRLEKADIIFIPGSFYGKLGEEAAKLWKNGYAPFIVPSGHSSILQQANYENKQQTECEFLTNILEENGVERRAIFQENKATFTQENARYSKKLLEEKGIKIKKAIICCKSFHARRCFMYYQLAFPETEFMIYPVVYCKDGMEITRENWHQTEEGIELVLGELRRYGEQFKEEFMNLLNK